MQRFVWVALCSLSVVGFRCADPAPPPRPSPSTDVRTTTTAPKVNCQLAPLSESCLQLPPGLRGLSVLDDELTGLPSRVSGFDVWLGRLGSEGDVVRGVERFLRANREALGLSALELLRVERERTRVGQGFVDGWRLGFRQIVSATDRRPGFGTHVTVAVLDDHVRSLAMFSLPGLSAVSPPRLSEVDALALARAATDHTPQGSGSAEAGAWPVVVTPEPREVRRRSVRLVSAWKVTLLGEEQNPDHHLVVVDAASGRVLHQRIQQTAYQVTGTVTGTVRTPGPNPVVQPGTPLRHETLELLLPPPDQGTLPPVTNPGDPNVTDVLGNYAIQFNATPGDKLTLISKLAGPYFFVQSDPSGLSANESSYAQLIDEAADNLIDIDWANHDPSSGFGQTNVFHHLGRAYDFFVRDDGSAFNVAGITSGGPLPAYTRWDDLLGSGDCRALTAGTWPNVEIRYNDDTQSTVDKLTGEVTPCPNFPLNPQVAYHEYTHYVASYLSQGVASISPEVNKMPGALGEAFAFYFETAISGFESANTDNELRLYDFDWSPCNDIDDLFCDVHKNGAIASGFMGSFRARGATSFTAPYDDAYADEVVFRALKKHPQTFEQLVVDILAEDNDLASAAGGANHAPDICAASWDEHSIAVEACCELTQTPLIQIHWPHAAVFNGHPAFNPLTTDLASTDPGAFSDVQPGHLPVIATVCPSVNATATVTWEAFVRPWAEPGPPSTTLPLPSFSQGVGLQKELRLPVDLHMVPLPSDIYELTIAANDGASLSSNLVEVSIDDDYYDYEVSADFVLTEDLPGTDPDDDGVFHVVSDASIDFDCANHLHRGAATGWRGERGVGIATTGPGSVVLHRCRLENWRQGVYATQAGFHGVRLSSFSEDDVGIARSTGDTDFILGNTFTDSGIGVSTRMAAGFIIEHNTFSNLIHAVFIDESGGGYSDFAGNTVTGGVAGLSLLWPEAEEIDIGGGPQRMTGLLGPAINVVHPTLQRLGIHSNLVATGTTDSAINVTYIEVPPQITILQNQVTSSGGCLRLDAAGATTGGGPQGIEVEWRMQDNTFGPCGDAAMWLRGGAYPNSTNKVLLVAELNQVLGAPTGIRLQHTTDAAVLHNVVEQTGIGISSSTGNGDYLFDNRVSASTTGLDLVGFDLTVEANVLTQVDNSFADPEQPSRGLILKGCIGCLVDHNEATGFQTGIAAGIPGGTFLSNDIRFNTVSQAGIGIFSEPSQASAKSTYEGNVLDASSYGMVINVPANLINNAVTGPELFGYRLQNAPGSRLLDNRATDVGGTGIWVSASPNVRLVNNNVLRARVAGIVLHQSATSEIQNNIVNQSANTTDGTALAGIYLADSPDAKVEVNVVLGTVGGFAIWVHQGSDGAELFANQIDLAEVGIALGGDDFVATHNLMLNVHQYGIMATGSDGVVVNNFIGAAGGALDNGVNNQWNLPLQPGINVVGGAWLGGNHHQDYAGGPGPQPGIGQPHSIDGTSGSVDLYPLLWP